MKKYGRRSFLQLLGLGAAAAPVLPQLLEDAAKSQAVMEFDFAKAGSDVTAVATIENGVVTAIRIVNAGSGYLPQAQWLQISDKR